MNAPAVTRFFWLALLCAIVAAIGCRDMSPLPAERLNEARGVGTDIRLAFNKATDASNRAVMADTDEASIAFASEAREAKKNVERDLNTLAPLLLGLSLTEETRTLEDLRKRFAEYDAVDRTVLDLAVENTNLKAQRLSFGPARDAANALRNSLDAVARSAPPKTSCPAAALVSSVVLAVREIQILHAPHIAESDDAAMTRMEKEMDDLEATARSSLASLASLVGSDARKDLDAALEALDRFKGIHVEIIKLSRKNTNVRSLMLALGQERTLSSACDASLAALVGLLATKRIPATR